MGSVYEVFDREAQRSIALKTLQQANPASVYRFKQEFRTLADVQHPNLVHLYEFVADESGDVFFTMELVRGTHFLKYARDAHGQADYDRVRHALRQLVEGVQALHSAGKLHRDIKPSNVLVTAEGRVVILDFGVAAELSTAGGHSMAQREIVGTAPYMAPEQARAAVPHQASDWYSVGVVLYAALTGSPPFVGTPEEIIAQKLAANPVPPSQRARDVPADLESLCMSLLAPVRRRVRPGPRSCDALVCPTSVRTTWRACARKPRRRSSAATPTCERSKTRSRRRTPGARSWCSRRGFLAWESRR